MSDPFSYARAFQRNLGLVSESEQARLRATRVGLAGLGGVGGAHLQALSRLGIGAFHLADLDRFEVANLNRQLGATLDTVGRTKVEVMAEAARAINPEVQIGTFEDGITPRNLDSFLDGVDVVVDGIEFFAIATHRHLHAACRRRRVPVVQAGPVGYGAAVWTFQPAGLSFDRFFGLDEEMTWAEKILAFSLGHSPSLLLSEIDPTRVNLEAREAPALVSACLLCAAVAATEVLKLVCGRGRLSAAPQGVYFDPYRGKTFRLTPRPSLTHSLRGRLLRYLAFRRVPALRELHRREHGERAQGRLLEPLADARLP